MKVNPYLFFEGNCREAFQLYAKVLGATIEAMMPHAGTPAEQDVPADWADKIIHASMVIDGQRLMASDAPPGRSQKPQGFYVSLQVATIEEAERIFGELSSGGKITMPLTETFWAQRFGMFVDRFGTPWMLNCPANSSTA